MVGVTEQVYVAFSKGRNVISRLICWLTRGRTSHSAILYVSHTWGGTWVAEATASGVHTYPMPSNDVWAYRYLLKYDAHEDFASARRYFEEHYDYVGLLAYGWILLLGRVFKRRVKHPLRSTSGQFCSEFVAHALRKIVTEDPQWVSPEQLLQIVEKDSINFVKI